MKAILVRRTVSKEIFAIINIISVGTYEIKTFLRSMSTSIYHFLEMTHLTYPNFLIFIVSFIMHT